MFGSSATAECWFLLCNLGRWRSRKFPLTCTKLALVGLSTVVWHRVAVCPREQPGTVWRSPTTTFQFCRLSKVFSGIITDMSLPITDVQMAWLADLTGQFQFHYQVSPAPVKVVSLCTCSKGNKIPQLHHTFWLCSWRYTSSVHTVLGPGVRQVYPPACHMHLRWKQATVCLFSRAVIPNWCHVFINVIIKWMKSCLLMTRYRFSVCFCRNRFLAKCQSLH